MSARAEAVPPSVDDIVAQVTGRRPLRRTPLSGGCIAEIFKIELDGGGAVVAKVAEGGGLDIEGVMLDYLRTHGLPVPEVLYGTETVLLLEYIETEGGLGAGAGQSQPLLSRGRYRTSGRRGAAAPGAGRARRRRHRHRQRCTRPRTAGRPG